jgi:lipopolysaccharide biosynthesis glycosyltransferase
MQSVNVCFACDLGYVQHAAVAITSLLRNTKTAKRVTVHLLHDFKETGPLDCLNEIAQSYGAALSPHAISDDFSKRKLGFHFTPAIYYRINLPRILPAVDQCLYLDCDLVVCGDVCELWASDLENRPIAAVEEPGGSANNARLRLPKNGLYFNSGVLMLNMAAWREQNISSQVNDFIEQNQQLLLMPDQDALNAVLHDRWVPLHPRWNVQTCMFTEAASRYSNPVALAEAIRNPAIIHYSTSSKPWHYMNNHPMKNRYYQYSTTIPWANPALQGRTFKNVIRKFCYTVMRKQYI